MKSSKKSQWLMAACALLLAGCVAPQKLQKARTDFSSYSAQRHQRDILERCADAGALPGTTAELQCRMGLARPANPGKAAN